MHVGRFGCGFLVAASMLSQTVVAPANAQAGDLVAHNGFEACWSLALTKPQFLSLLQSSIEGQTYCIAPSSGTLSGSVSGTYTACDTPACSGGVHGCPVTLHSGAWTGDFAAGSFSGPGSADDVVVPVSYDVGFSGTCNVTISGIGLNYAAGYAEQADGNNGDYLVALNEATVTVTGYTAGGSDPVCTVAASQVGPQAVSQAQTTGSALLTDQLTTATVGKSLCPLTP